MGHPNNQGTPIIIMILIINEDQGVDKKRKRWKRVCLNCNRTEIHVEESLPLILMPLMGELEEAMLDGYFFVGVGVLGLCVRRSKEKVERELFSGEWSRQVE